MPIFAAALAGVIFGIGLLLSGMANPGKVLGFLDLAGHWDPSLAMVMAGAIAVGVVGFTVAKRRSHSLLKLPMQLPTATAIDRRLVIGSALFGIGWGLAGVCPGPALVTLAMGVPQAIVFVVAMLAGMWLFHFMQLKDK
ncbi:MAG: YeeE/YedE family protein [Betaproteobacteria bacterium]|nr:YeeE/YedE family protein [Betaproteobacteria bacterium]